MANGCCTNELCIKRETQLRLARLREELLTNFNTFLIDRIRFLEQTVNRLSLTPSPVNSSSPSSNKDASPKSLKLDRLKPPSMLRRSSSAAASFLPSPVNSYTIEPGASPRSCPSSVDLSMNKESRKYFFSPKKSIRTDDRTSLSYHNTYLSIPKLRQWACSTTDLPSTTNTNNEQGRLVSRRFACDVDDNDIRAFKAMVYMEQARKQHARPLTRLRQALGISTNSATGNYTMNNSKKHSNP